MTSGRGFFVWGGIEECWKRWDRYSSLKDSTMLQVMLHHCIVIYIFYFFLQTIG